MTARSLRRRLLRTVCVASLLGLTLCGIFSYQQAQHEAEELMDGHLAQTGRLLLALVQDNESRLSDLATRLTRLKGSSSLYEPLLEFQIGRADGTLLMRSEHPPQTSLSIEPGYSILEHDGHLWRMLTLASDTGDYRVQIGQSGRLRDRAALEIARQTVFPIALIAPVSLLLIYFSIRRGLKPLDDLAADVAARSPENLRPLVSTRAPAEVRPLLAALNRLLGRLGEALASERRFTADAAHELRTPLAVVKVQAQVAQLSRNSEDRQHAIEQIVVGADRAARVVEQLLRLARLDPLAGLPYPGEVDLCALIEEVHAETRHDVKDGRVRRHLVEGPLMARGDAELLKIALRNLLDNALRYTPPESTIDLFARREYGNWVVGVADNGAGVAPDDLPRLVERFYRGRRASGDGSGLGLAIVHRIAELHEARFEAENLVGGGFEARLRGPAALDAAPFLRQVGLRGGE